MALTCNNETCLTLESKLTALSVLLDSIPPSGGGLVPYTSDGHCGGAQGIPSLTDLLDSVGDVLCALSCLFCNLDICAEVVSCLGQIDLCPFVSACLPNLPSATSTSPLKGVLGRACDDSIVLVEMTTSKLNIPIGNMTSLQERPFSDPSWTQLALPVAGGTYTSKIIQLGTFDLSGYPSPCTGFKWVASINNQLDHIPSFQLGPVNPQEEGYTGIQTLVNGVAGINGPNLVGGIWIHRGGARGYGPTIFHHNYFDVNLGVNTISMQISTTRSGGVYNELAEFGTHQIQVFVEQIKI